MNKFFGATVAAMFVAASSFSVLAIEPEQGTGGAPKMQQQPAAPMQQPAAQETGQQQQRISGTVSRINKKTGFVNLSSSDGPLTLHFPPQAVRDLKKGEPITAQFAFAKAGKSASTRAYDVPKGLGEHRMTGTVSKVDHTKGWLNVKTQHGTLHLHFPSDMVRDVKKGDRLTLDLAYSKGA